MHIDAMTTDWAAAQAMLSNVPATDKLIWAIGSARIKQGPIYASALSASKAISDAGMRLISPAGSGLMQAFNEGSPNAVNVAINLPGFEETNQYVDQANFVRCETFAIRKLACYLRASACIAFPGGFGTMDELFELLTLISTYKILAIPIVLCAFDRDSKAYWSYFADFALAMYSCDALSLASLDRLQYAYDANQMLELIA